LLYQHLQQSELIKFCKNFLLKQLARNPNWIKCQNSKECQYGFVVFEEKNQEKTCPYCKQVQMVSKNPIESEQGFQAMLKAGTLKLCPKCQFPTMKDIGMCNVLQCGQCGIWWNWKTFEFSTNSKDLKNKARDHGTLWEHGELEYQRRLQRENPEEFKKLLERNGIQYDSNYIRGTR